MPTVGMTVVSVGSQTRMAPHALAWGLDHSYVSKHVAKVEASTTPLHLFPYLVHQDSPIIQDN